MTEQQTQMTGQVPDEPAGVRTVIPGPADRSSFFAEQARRRRQARWYSLLAGVAAVVLGIPFAMLVTPLIYLVAAVLLRLADAIVPVPDEAWSALRGIATLFEAPPRTATGGTFVRWAGVLVRAGALFVPGMIATVLAWRWLRRLFAEDGALEGMLARLGARAPAPGDLEERQLVNVVEEMAIAGGLPPPRVRVLDADVPNAAVLGADVEQATVVVTRGLLNRLRRDETQAVVGHLVAAAGNGDLRVALAMTTLFQTVGLVFTAFEAAMNLSQAAWRDLLAVGRWAVAPAGRRGAEAGAAVASLLDHNIDTVREDGLYGLLQEVTSKAPAARAARPGRRALMLLALPLALIYMVVFVFVRFEIFLVRVGVIGPLLMLAYRARRYQADAAAVQLTRDPDALSGALERLANEGAAVPGGRWFSHLFIVGPEAAAERRALAHRKAIVELRRTGSFRDIYAAHRRHGDEEAAAARGTWAQELGGAASHPKISRRLKRLAKMGARLRAQGLLGVDAALRDEERRALRAAPRAMHALSGLLAVLLLPLLALIVYMIGVVLVMVLGFATLFALAFMAVALRVLQLLLP